MEIVIKAIKIPVPRKWLFLAVAALWTFASVKVFSTAWKGAMDTHLSVYFFIWFSVVGSIIFTRLVFLKVTSRYIKRIHNMVESRPSLFSMLSTKSYLLLALMIAMGIITKNTNIIPQQYLTLFLGALSLSLLTSAAIFLNEWRLNAICINRKK